MDELAVAVAERVIETVACVAPGGTAPSARDAKRISTVVRHIEQQAEAAIDLDALAALACMSKYHFLRTFRRLVGTTPYRFVLDLRLRRAAVARTTTRETVGPLAVRPRYRTIAPPPGATKEGYERQHSAVEYLTDHFHEAPIWIVPCIEDKNPPNRTSGASIYPAVQNMLLAARALGLGATLTTRHLLYEKESEAALGLPPGVHSYAILPIGWPMGKFGPVKRGPLAEIVYQDKWGQPYAAV